MKHILKKIKEYKRIIINGHIRPDGDSIGSGYGLMYLIKESFPDKEVYITGESSSYLSFIGMPTFINEDLFKNSLCICLDCGNKDRLGDNRYKLSDYTIKIDHHFDSDKYTDYEYIDSTSSSTAEIIIEFYTKYKDELVMCKKCAESLYTGLLTDTGNFRYGNISSKTFYLASVLLNYNIDIDFINKKLSIETYELLKLKGYCLSNFKITNNGFGYIVLDKKTMKEYNVTEEEAASLVNLISGLENIYVWAMILESKNNIRIRLRSKGPAINELASIYGGGGHKLASGANLNDFTELEQFVTDADNLVKEYKKRSKNKLLYKRN